MQNKIINPEPLLSQVRKPSRYCGNEVNSRSQPWDKSKLRYALVFPDMYEIGMSHQGLQILYHIINDQPQLLAERVYAPDTDLEELLRSSHTPLFSLESRHSLADFDVLAITLPYELCATNILTILDLAGIPLRAADRDPARHPLILGGGPGAFNPEPIADFFDALLLGDGEEAIVEISAILLAAKEENWSTDHLFTNLATSPGVYIPARYTPTYNGQDEFTGLHSSPPIHPVRRRILNQLPKTIPPAPLVPLNKIVHDRLGLEVARGCTRGCRFCQAGIIYRPVRERSPEQLYDMALSGINATGFEEMALLSLSTGDYSCLSPLLVKLMDYFAQRQVSVSLPSMRVGTLTPDIMAQIKRVRKSGFTVAPEAGTDRLRRVINKGITEEDLLATCSAAFELGWKLLKFYFMFGLPTEQQEDIQAIADLAGKAMKMGKGPGRAITVSAATFVPKPHTPFQWQRQLSIEEGFARIDYLKEALRSKGAKLRWGNPKMSFLEGVFARGDRQLSFLIEEAWQRGARFDAWSDYFNLSTWQGAATALGIKLERYLEPRPMDHPLPWDHLDCGVAPEFLRDEYDRALSEAYTPDCRQHGCQKCGLCDFKDVFPRTFQNHQPQWPATTGTTPPQGQSHHHYRLDYQRLQRSRLLSHLELLQLFFRAFNRVGLPIHYSKGYNPSPKVSFSPALPLGTESLCEYLLLDCQTTIDCEKFTETLNATLPEGMTITAITAIQDKSIPNRTISTYRINLPLAIDTQVVASFMAAPSFQVTVIRKKKERQIDARLLVVNLIKVDENVLELKLLAEVSKAGLKPMEIITAIGNLSPQQIQATRVVKTAINLSP